jgi:hypothetical protein
MKKCAGTLRALTFEVSKLALRQLSSVDVFEEVAALCQ